MKTNIRIFIFIFFLLIGFATSAKEYPMLHYTIEDGLASNTIYDIYQDPSGMIWIGTDKGISRFNGLKFENFTTADGLSDNECFFFQPDYDGRLWIGTYNGKLCFYKDGVFHNEKNTPWLKLKINASHSLSINLNSDSSLIFTFQDAPAFLEVKKEKIITRTDDFMKKRYFELSEFKGSLIVFVKKIKKNAFKIYYFDGIYTLDNNKKSFKYNNKNIGIQKGYRSKNNFILLSGNGSFYDTFRDTLMNLTNNGKIISKLNDFLILDDRTIYATLNGLYIDNELIKEGKFNSIASDNYGNFWAGTSNNGVVLFNFHSDKFSEISSSLIKNIFFSSTIKNKLLFITQDKSFYTIDIPFKRIINIHKDNPNNGFLNDNTFCSLIYENNLYCFNSRSMFSLKTINEK